MMRHLSFEWPRAGLRQRLGVGLGIDHDACVGGALEQASIEGVA
jgi:hypothetical protein